MAGDAHIPPAEFATALGQLDAERVAAFVGELRRATADEVTVDPPVVTVRVGGETTRLLVGPAGDSHVPAGVDAVVLPGAGGGDWDRPTVGPDDLRRRLLYALDPAEADALCERFLGRPARSDSYVDGPAAGGDDASAGKAAIPRPGTSDRPAGSRNWLPGETLSGLTTRAGRRGVVVLVVAVVVLTAGGTAALVVGPGSGTAGVSTSGGGAAASTPAGIDGTQADTGTDTPGPATPGEGPTTLAGGNTLAAGGGGESGLDADRYASLEPTCNRSYLHVVQIQMNALKYNDPETNDGIRTVRRFASPPNREAVSYEELVRLVNGPAYNAMLSYDSVEYAPERTSEGSARVEVVTRENGTTTGEFTFRLTKQVGGAYDGCWMTDGVTSADAYPS